MLDPEHTKSHEIGLNAGFLNDKISLAFTMYKTSTSDLPFGGYLSIPSQGIFISCIMGPRLIIKVSSLS